MVVIIGVDAVDIAVMQSVESRTRGVLDWYLDASSVGLLDAKGRTTTGIGLISKIQWEESN